MKKNKPRKLLPKRLGRLFLRRILRLGFTLIELLIVIAILGIIGSIVVFRLLNSTDKARDGTRKANLGQIASALEQYYTDNGFHYIPGNFTSQSGDNWIPGLNPYFKTIPKDPKQASIASFLAGIPSSIISELGKLGPKAAYAVTPVNGTVTGPTCAAYGTKYRFTATYNDSAGASDILYAYIMINSTNVYDTAGAPQGAFLAVLNYTVGDIAVKDDTGGIWYWSASGVNGNSYADLDRVTTSYSGIGNTLTINWDITFKNTWQPENTQVWIRAADHSGVPTPYTSNLSLQIPCPAPTSTPTPVPTPAPTGAAGSADYYYAYYSDPAGTYYELWARLEDSSDLLINTAANAKCKLPVPAGAPIAFNYCVSSHR